MSHLAAAEPLQNCTKAVAETAQGFIGAAAGQHQSRAELLQIVAGVFSLQPREIGPTDFGSNPARTHSQLAAARFQNCSRARGELHASWFKILERRGKGEEK